MDYSAIGGMVSQGASPGSGGGNGVDFFDADEQKYLNIQKLDRLMLMWLQVRECVHSMNRDPRGKGKYMKQIIGRGDKTIIQDVWVEDPRVAYFYNVRQLLVLLWPELSEDAVFSEDYSKLLEENKSLDKYAYSRTEKLFKLLMLYVEKYYGRERTITDRVVGLEFE